jgi:hypothetical protein
LQSEAGRQTFLLAPQMPEWLRRHGYGARQCLRLRQRGQRGRWQVRVPARGAVGALKERFLRLGLELQTGSAEQFGKVLAADAARWVPVVKTSGYKLD